VHFHELEFPTEIDKSKNFGEGRTRYQGIRDMTSEFLIGVGILKKTDDNVIDPATGSTRIDTASLASRLKGVNFIGRIQHWVETDKSDPPKKYDKIGFRYGTGASTCDDPRN